MFKAINTRDLTEIVILAEEWAGRLDRLRALDRADELVCQGCRQPVRTKAGAIRTWHFAHKHLANCRYGEEPPEVLECRALLFRRLQNEFGDAVTLEKQLDEFPRPVDCWVEMEGRRLAYWIVHTRLKPDVREILAAGFRRLKAEANWIFTAGMLTPDEANPAVIHLTTTEREFQQESWFDRECRDPRAPAGASLHYLDPDAGDLITYRNLMLVHEPQVFAGRRLSGPLAGALVSHKTGEFAHPGEREHARKMREERARAEREAKEREERARREAEERARQEQIRQQQLAEQRRREAEERVRQEQITQERLAEQRRRARLAERTTQRAAGPPPAPAGALDGIVNREGTCVFCGKVTRDWWTHDGATGTCKCRECQRKGRV